MNHFLLAQAAPSAALGTLGVILFFVAVSGVIAFGIWQGNKGKDGAGSGGAAGYFLAGRGLTWWLVGFSLIAANISTEQFLGMSGQAAITLVVVAFVFLPNRALRGAQVVHRLRDAVPQPHGRLLRCRDGHSGSGHAHQTHGQTGRPAHHRPHRLGILQIGQNLGYRGRGLHARPLRNLLVISDFPKTLIDAFQAPRP